MFGPGNLMGRPRRPFVYDEVRVGEELASYEYVLTEEQLQNFRDSIEVPTALFPTIAIKSDSTALNLKYDAGGRGINARQAFEFFNPPIPGKKIRVTGKVINKYTKRDKPYLVIQATAVDEDGRLIERVTTYQMRRTEEVGKKWGK